MVAILLCWMMISSLLSCDLTEDQDDVLPDEKVDADLSGQIEKDNTTNAAQSSKADIAMEMYDMVLKNEIRVYETDIEEYNYLKDCKTPYNRIPLCELESLRYVYMDVDGDLIDELVMDCSDILVLRYYEGTVYVYPFTFRNMYRLNTDGSYNWNHTGQDFEYGENQLAFNGAELETKELWRIVNDGAPNAEYYIEDKQVTQQEILKYFADNPKTEVEFLSHVSWEGKEYPDEKG